MQNSSSLRNTAERPSAIVCIAYRQLSTMIGIKDPTEPPKIEEPAKQNDAIVKTSIADLQLRSMKCFIELSRDMSESFRSILENMKVRLENFRAQNPAMFDVFPLSHLPKWSQREQ